MNNRNHHQPILSKELFLDHPEWEHREEDLSYMCHEDQNSKFIGEPGLVDLLREIQDYSDASLSGISRNGSDAFFYKEKMYEMVKINYSFQNHIIRIKESLTIAINFIHENLDKHINDFQIFSNYAQNCSFEETSNMAEFVRLSLTKLREFDRGRETVDKDKYLKLKAQNSILAKQNQKLNNHIKERKKYSESLKARIVKLKEQVSSKDEQNKKILCNIDQFEADKDLKYRNRNELIGIIKILVGQMLKHSKECGNKGDIELTLDMIEKLSLRTNKEKSSKEGLDQHKQQNGSRCNL